MSFTSTAGSTAAEVLNSAPTSTFTDPPFFVLNFPFDSFVSFDLNDYFDDADGDTLTFSTRNLLDGVYLDSVTGIVSGYVESLSGPRVQVQVVADDGNGASLMVRFIMNITAIVDYGFTENGDIVELNDKLNDVNALGGNDLVLGGVKADIIRGGAGADDLFGLKGNDWLYGDTGADRLLGSKGADVLEGGEGNDKLVGGAGRDILIGGAGADILLGGVGPDTASYEGSSLGVSIDISYENGGYHVSGGDAEGDVLHRIENLTGTDFYDELSGNKLKNILKGGAGTDDLVGRGGNDKLFGGAGDDRLNGGIGTDRLNGGSGNDVFDFSRSWEADGDTIEDFEHLSDKLHIFFIGSEIETGDAPNYGFTFVGTDRINDAGEVKYSQITTAGGQDFTLVKANLDGGDGADFTIRLAGHIDLTVDDFIL